MGAMNENRQDWYVTIRLDECRTRDVRIAARNAYAARWTYEHSQPEGPVVMVRPVCH